MTSPKPTNTPHSVFRGGGWCFVYAAGVRSAHRYRVAHAVRNYYLGFRTTQSGCRMPLTKA